MDVRPIEIPAKRILELDRRYFEQNYKQLNAEGDDLRFGQQPYRAVRYKDSRVFKMAEFVPAHPEQKDCVYLEEL